VKSHSTIVSLQKGETMRLEGKVALVTGAGSGIGQAIALLFAKEGADIAVNDIDLSSAEETAGAVKQIGRKAIAVRADVAKADEVDAMVDRVINELGGVHILVNNAGIPVHGPLLGEQTPENWDRVVGVILRGTYLCSRRVGQWMVSRKTGKIVNISSVAGIAGSPTLTSYGAAKAGVINLTRALAVDWGKYNINVNCIAPGVIDTPLTQRTFARWLTPEQITEPIPLGRMGEADEVAKAALFLVSDDAGYITGVTLPVDGGKLA
jgi:NAD(P)-dependent dehydrogenase (short-subunit alcohol dehydrogenase family)